MEMWLDGRDERPMVDYRGVTPSFFRAMGIELRGGRLFAQPDGQRLVGLVSARTAQRVWPGENPIGKRFRLGGAEANPVEVVGWWATSAPVWKRRPT